MIRINPPVFVPADAKFVKKITSVLDDEVLLSFEDKVKRNPYLREVFRMESSPDIRERPVEKKEKKRSIEIKGVEAKTTKTAYTGKMEYIKNLTETPLLLFVPDEHVVVDFKNRFNNAGGKCLFKYTAKSSLSKKELNSEQLQALYDDGRIEDITKQQYQEEIKQYNGVDPLRPVAVKKGDGCRILGDRKKFMEESSQSDNDLLVEPGGNMESEEEALARQFGLKR